MTAVETECSHNPPGIPVEISSSIKVQTPASVLYIDPELWRARKQVITRFLDCHLSSPHDRSVQVWNGDPLADNRPASTSSGAPLSPLPQELAETTQVIISVRENSARNGDLECLRKHVAQNGIWQEQRWTITETSSDEAKEFCTVEIVIFTKPSRSRSLAASRWGLPRLLNPFARPMRTTDYYGSGDANLDGIFDDLDPTCTEEVIAGNRDPTDRADVTGDGVVNSEDVTLMREVLSGARDYLPGWWDRLTTREERNEWINKMLAIDPTDNHPYDPPFFVCRNFSGVLVLNHTGYDGAFHGEPSKWMTPGRFNLPMCQVILANLSHAITAILVGDDPRQLNSWRFIEPQSDSDGCEWFRPGERIFIQATSHFSPLGGMSSARSLLIFELDESGQPHVEHTDPDLVTIRLSSVDVSPPDPTTGQRIRFTARTTSDGITAASVLLRPSGDDTSAMRIGLQDDGLHDDVAARDGVWGGSAIVEERANLFVDLAVNLADGGEITYAQANWFSMWDGTWCVSPQGSDANPGSGSQPFQTIGRAMQVAFPGDTICVAPGLYPESVRINKGNLQISGIGSCSEDISVTELFVDYGTEIEIRDLSCQFAGTYYASSPSFSWCRMLEGFEAAEAHANLNSCHTKEVQTWDSSVFLRDSLISNPDGLGVSIHCPRTTEPSRVRLEIINCTIVNSNVAVSCTAGDEGYPCTLHIMNSILWDNAIDIAYDYPQIRPTRCDIGNGWTEPGDNISLDPLFADPSEGDYHLMAGSPCIDAGDNSVLGAPGLDLARNLRVAMGEHSLTVDMGAYEYHSSAFAVKQITPVDNHRLLVIWNSQPQDTYTLWSRHEFSAPTWIEVVTLPSQGTTTVWTDTSAVGRMKLYRVEMK